MMRKMLHVLPSGNLADGFVMRDVADGLLWRSGWSVQLLVLLWRRRMSPRRRSVSAGTGFCEWRYRGL